MSKCLHPLQAHSIYAQLELTIEIGTVHFINLDIFGVIYNVILEQRDHHITTMTVLPEGLEVCRPMDRCSKMGFGNEFSSYEPEQ